MIATIHQPDFMPWLGFFKKLHSADLWIVLDHVENNPRDAAFWGRRVKILKNGDPFWFSIPLMKPTLPGVIGVPIMDMKVKRSERFLELEHQIIQAYEETSFFNNYSYLVTDYLRSNSIDLVELNMNFIQSVLDLLNIKPTIVFSSKLKARGSSTQLLINLLKEVGASTYISGTGSAGYMDENQFSEAKIELRYNKFEHPIYDQNSKAGFVPGLSILDPLFSHGSTLLRTWFT